MVLRYNDLFSGMFQELDSLRREVDRAFQEAGLGRWTRPFSRYSFLPGWRARVYPLVNLSEDKEAVHVEAMAPGITPDSLNISVLKDQLTLSGEKAGPGDEVKDTDYHRSERATGKFLRTIRLPVEVNADKVAADYKDGQLSLTLPKAETAKPKQITVKTG